MHSHNFSEKIMWAIQSVELKAYRAFLICNHSATYCLDQSMISLPSSHVSSESLEHVNSCGHQYRSRNFMQSVGQCVEDRFNQLGIR